MLRYVSLGRTESVEGYQVARIDLEQSQAALSGVATASPGLSTAWSTTAPNSCAGILGARRRNAISMSPRLATSINPGPCWHYRLTWFEIEL